MHITLSLISTDMQWWQTRANKLYWWATYSNCTEGRIIYVLYKLWQRTQFRREFLHQMRAQSTCTCKSVIWFHRCSERADNSPEHDGCSKLARLASCLCPFGQSCQMPRPSSFATIEGYNVVVHEAEKPYTEAKRILTQDGTIHKSMQTTRNNEEFLISMNS